MAKPLGRRSLAGSLVAVPLNQRGCRGIERAEQAAGCADRGEIEGRRGTGLPSAAAPKAQSPKKGDGDRVALGIQQISIELSAAGIESENLAIAEIPDQQIVAEGAEIARCERQTPRRIEPHPVLIFADELAVRGKGGHPARSGRGGAKSVCGIQLGESDEERAADILDIIRRQVERAKRSFIVALGWVERIVTYRDRIDRGVENVDAAIP